MVGLEPSCLAVFRDELRNLFPGDQDARRLAGQSFTLAELLNRRAPGFQPPALRREAIVQRHCHHHAVMGFTEDAKLLERAGLDAELLDSGCCGMAGSFGFEAGDRYEVGIKAGERVLLPRVRAADPSTLVVADGFSCRTQIEQGSDRRALHLAEVLRLALHGGGPVRDGRPEDAAAALDAATRGPRPPWRARALALGGASAGSASPTPPGPACR